MHQEEFPSQQTTEIPPYDGMTIPPSQPESYPMSHQSSNQGGNAVLVDDYASNSTPSPSPPSTDHASTTGGLGAGRQRSKSGTGHLTMQQLNKKRQRATPEQLVVLEEAFIVNPSPNAKMREMIADRIRMTERSVQIWFQNRRAKVKQLQRKEADGDGVYFGMGGTPGVMDQMKRTVLMRSNSLGGHAGQYGGGALPPDIKFGLRMGSWNGPLTPAASPSSKTVISRLSIETLSIGSWHRVACSSMDLVCYYSAMEGRFTYYINNSSAGFKIEFPAQLIKGIKMEHVVRKVTTEGNIATPSREELKHRARIMIELVSPPSFYSEQRGSGGWQLCHDFTQGLVASRVFLHTLVGPYDQLHAQITELAAMSPELSSRLWIDDKPQLLASEDEDQSAAAEERRQAGTPGLMAPPRPASTIPAQFARQHLTPTPVPVFNATGLVGQRGARPPFAHRRTRSRSLPTAINVSELAIAASQHQFPNTLVPGMRYTHETSHFVPATTQEMLYHGQTTPLRIDTSVADGMDFYRQFTPSSNMSSLTPVDYLASPASQLPLQSSLPFYDGPDYASVTPASYGHSAVYPTEATLESHHAVYTDTSPMITMGEFHPQESYTYSGTPDPSAMQETSYAAVHDPQWTAHTPQVTVTSQMDVDGAGKDDAMMKSHDIDTKMDVAE